MKPNRLEPLAVLGPLLLVAIFLSIVGLTHRLAANPPTKAAGLEYAPYQFVIYNPWHVDSCPIAENTFVSDSPESAYALVVSSHPEINWEGEIRVEICRFGTTDLHVFTVD